VGESTIFAHLGIVKAELIPANRPVTDNEDIEELRHELEELRTEHRDLDDVIARVAEEAPFDQLRIQRLKKRKLKLKDEIARLESELLPDIIA
jgi:hypothetical protein